MTDEVNRPDHYNKGGIQVINVIETYTPDSPHLANVLKYVCRHSYKGNALQDLRKAQWYLSRKIELLEAEQDCDEWEADLGNAEWTGRLSQSDWPGIDALVAKEYTFHSSLATRIAGEDESSQKIKDEYYKFDRYEIIGYCASCDAEIAAGQPYVKSNKFDADLKFCKQQCVNSLIAWQKDGKL